MTALPFTWQNKQVIVTGSSGFLGSNFMALLKHLEITDVYAPPHIAADLTQPEHVERLFFKAPRTGQSRVVVALAGKVGGIQANLNQPADFFYDNLLINAFTIHYSRVYQVVKVCLIGAGCGYPEAALLPLKEENFWDGYPQLPSASYSLAKRMIHTQAIAENQQYDLQSVIVMPGNIYGPHDNFDLVTAHVIPALVRKFVDAATLHATEVEVWGSGKATRDFVYVGDICAMLVKAAEVYEKPQLVNVSSGVETSISAVVDCLIQLTGYRGRVKWNKSKPEGQERRWFDNSKATADLGYEPTPLYGGLERTVRWYRDNKDMVRR